MSGRPTKYLDCYADQAYKLGLLGATDNDLSSFFGVSESTINLWKKRNPEFLESLKKGKMIADAEVSYSLFRRAVGYKYPEENIVKQKYDIKVVETMKYYPPDTTACIFWLKNRQRYKWQNENRLIDDDPAPLEIKFDVAEPIGDIRVTHSADKLC